MNFTSLSLTALVAICSQAMKRFEPGTLDMFGAHWEAGGSYRMQPDARRYEQYERSFAAVVGLRDLQHGK